MPRISSAWKAQQAARAKIAAIKAKAAAAKARAKAIADAKARIAAVKAKVAAAKAKARAKAKPKPKSAPKKKAKVTPEPTIIKKVLAGPVGKAPVLPTIKPTPPAPKIVVTPPIVTPSLPLVSVPKPSVAEMAKKGPITPITPILEKLVPTKPAEPPVVPLVPFISKPLTPVQKEPRPVKPSLELIAKRLPEIHPAKVILEKVIEKRKVIITKRESKLLNQARRSSNWIDPTTNKSVHWLVLENQGYRVRINPTTREVEAYYPSEIEHGKEHFDKLVKQYKGDKNLVYARLGAVAFMESPLAYDTIKNALKHGGAKTVISEYTEGLAKGKWNTVEQYIKGIRAEEKALLKAGYGKALAYSGARIGDFYAKPAMTDKEIRKILSKTPEEWDKLSSSVWYKLAASDIDYQSALKKGLPEYATKVVTAPAMVKGVIIPTAAILTAGTLSAGLGYMSEVAPAAAEVTKITTTLVGLGMGAIEAKEIGTLVYQGKIEQAVERAGYMGFIIAGAIPAFKKGFYKGVSKGYQTKVLAHIKAPATRAKYDMLFKAIKQSQKLPTGTKKVVALQDVENMSPDQVKAWTNFLKSPDAKNFKIVLGGSAAQESHLKATRAVHDMDLLIGQRTVPKPIFKGIRFQKWETSKVQEFTNILKKYGINVDKVDIHDLSAPGVLQAKAGAFIQAPEKTPGGLFEYQMPIGEQAGRKFASWADIRHLMRGKDIKDSLRIFNEQIKQAKLVAGKSIGPLKQTRLARVKELETLYGHLKKWAPTVKGKKLTDPLGSFYDAHPELAPARERTWWETVILKRAPPPEFLKPPPYTPKLAITPKPTLSEWQIAMRKMRPGWLEKVVRYKPTKPYKPVTGKPSITIPTKVSGRPPFIPTKEYPYSLYPTYGPAPKLVPYFIPPTLAYPTPIPVPYKPAPYVPPVEPTPVYEPTYYKPTPPPIPPPKYVPPKYTPPKPTPPKVTPPYVPPPTSPPVYKPPVYTPPIEPPYEPPIKPPYAPPGEPPKKPPYVLPTPPPKEPPYKPPPYVPPYTPPYKPPITPPPYKPPITSPPYKPAYKPPMVVIRPPPITKKEEEKKKKLELEERIRRKKFYTERVHEFPTFAPVKYPKPFTGPEPAKFKPVTFRAPETQRWIRGEEKRAGVRASSNRIPKTLK